ncbi:hypothetical protein AAHE18_16G190100 [Arachis hypogaea]
MFMWSSESLSNVSFPRPSDCEMPRRTRQVVRLWPSMPHCPHRCFLLLDSEAPPFVLHFLGSLGMLCPRSLVASPAPKASTCTPSLTLSASLTPPFCAASSSLN